MISNCDSKVVELSNLDDDLLRQVIEILPVENQFLVTRVCRRLSRLVYDEKSKSGTLIKVSKINGVSEMLCVGNFQVVKAFRKMPNLVSIGSSGGNLRYEIEDDVLNKVVKQNSKLISFGDWANYTIIRYIKMAKKHNSDYDETKVGHFFPDHYGNEDLTLKLCWDSIDSDNWQALPDTTLNRIVDIRLRFFFSDLHSSESVVEMSIHKIDNLSDHIPQLFQKFPMLKVVDITETESLAKITPRILFEGLKTLKNLEQIGLTSLSTHIGFSSPEWEEDDFEAFEQILMKPTVKCIALDGVHIKSEHLVLRSFMNCTRQNFKGFQINTLFIGHDSNVEIRGYPMHSLETMISKFRDDVHLIQIIIRRQVPMYAKGLRKVIEECQEFSNTHRRRQFRLQIETNRKVVHSFDF